MVNVAGFKVLIMLAAIACAMVIAACGSSSPKSAGTPDRYGPASSPASISRCMRAHGVSGFPDPRAGPNGGVGFPGGLMVTGSDSMVVMGIPFSGPALLQAEKACKEYLPPGGASPQVSAEQRRQALAFARCMRSHGVPSFPDPTFSGGQKAGPPAGINPQAPAFRSAARACGAGGAGNIAIGG
jgi:hypothetical protein